jgi:thiol-disulfide isomerase/thioredoxin
MRIVFTVTLIVAVLVTRAAGTDSLPAPMRVPGVQKMAITELESLITHSDHPMIIDFWATFCAPCNKEIPYFQTTVARFAGERVELVLVSLDLPDYYPAKIASFVQSHSYNARVVWLNETNADYFCPKVDLHWSGGIPSTLFINNKTHYRRFFDRQLTEAQVEPEIRKMLAP